MGQQATVLEHQAESALMGRKGADLPVVEADMAGIGPVQPRQQAYHAALAGSRAAEQGGDLRAAGGKSDVEREGALAFPQREVQHG